MENIQLISPLVSIIVPVRNGEKYIDNFMNILDRQTYTNLEIIFVNNLSTDNSMRILSKYELRQNITVLDANKGRLGYARNIGIQNSNGSYIVFLDVDDFLSDTYVEECLSMIEQYDADMVIANMARHIEMNIVSEYPKWYLGNGVGISSRKNLHSRNISACNKLYSAAFLRENALQFPEDTLHEDFVFTLNALSMAGEIIECRRATYYYTLNPDSHAYGDLDGVFKQFLSVYSSESSFVSKVRREIINEAAMLKLLMFFK